MNSLPFARSLPLLATLSLSLLTGCGEEPKAALTPAAVSPVPAPESATLAAIRATNVAAAPEATVKGRTPPPALSAAAEEIVQLAQAHVGEDVVLTYIDGSTRPFQLKAPEILYLSDLGLTAEVIAAMVRRDQALQAAPPVASTAAGESPASAVATAPAAEAAPATSAATVPAPAAAPDEGTVQTSEVTAPPAETSAEPVTYNYFYSSLSPYGTWMELPEYGWCWQPSVVTIHGGWRPYCHNGRWLWTDCGWYWQSYYSWGWAPFHYGRWYSHPSCGWVWAPDTCWGPAWVTWRHYDNYWGWAPLPPGCGYAYGGGLTYYGSGISLGFSFGLSSHCYSFIPANHFYSASPWTHCVAPTTVNNFYGNTTVINNYVQGDGNTIVNYGPGTRPFTSAGRTEIQRVALKDVGGLEGKAVQADRLSRDGTTLAVYRPKLPPQAARPPAAIVQRQQEVRRSADSLANSDAVRQAVTTSRNRPISAASISQSESPYSVGPARTPATARPREAARPPAPANYSREMAAPLTEPSRVLGQPASSTVPRVTRVEPSRPAADPRRPVAAPPKSAPPEVSRPGAVANPSAELRSSGTRLNEPRTGIRGSEPRPSPTAVPPARSVPAPAPPPTRIETPRSTTIAPAPSVAPTPSYGNPARPSPVLPPRTEPPRPVNNPPSVSRYTPAASQSTPAPIFIPASSRQAPAPSFTPPPARMAPSPAYSLPTAPRGTPSFASSSPRSGPSFAPPTPAAAPALSPRAAPAPAPSSSGNARYGGRNHER